MQEVVVHPGPIDDALASPRARAELPPGRLGEVVLPSRTLSPAQRIEIYQRMYPLRMEEALEIDYPTLKAGAYREPAGRPARVARGA